MKSNPIACPEKVLHFVTFVALLTLLQGCGPSLYELVSDRKYDEVKLKLDKGGNPDEVNQVNGATPLMQALVNKDSATTVLLLSKGASVNVLNKGGYSPLCFAVQSGNISLVKALIDKGADVNIVIDYKKYQESKTSVYNYGSNYQVFDVIVKGTPLLVALSLKYEEIGKLLIEKGANINYKDTQGVTALVYAVALNSYSLVKTLIERGADPNAKFQYISGRVGFTNTPFGGGVPEYIYSSQTALDFARQKKNDNIIRLLEAASKK